MHKYTYTYTTSRDLKGRPVSILGSTFESPPPSLYVHGQLDNHKSNKKPQVEQETPRTIKDERRSTEKKV